MKSTQFKPLLILFTLATLASSLSGCGRDDKGGEPAQSVRSVQARLEAVAPTELPVYHAAPATVVARSRVEVASRLMGYIRDIPVAEGQAVRRGQRLFTVDPLDVEGQVEQARAAVSQAEEAWRDAVADHDRYANLLKEEVVTRQQYDKAKLARDLAAARLAQARAQLATAYGQMRYATVTAPIDGVVTRKLADRGDLASPAQPVLTLESTGPMQVETQVPEAVLAGLQPGRTVMVEIDGRPGPVEARVSRISPAADPVSRTFLVKLDVAADGLKSGSFARVLFPQGSRQALTVPVQALVTRAGIEGVFVVDAQGLAHFRMVRTGERREGRVEIQAGLAAGERVVVEGAERLENGVRVSG
ncbi:MAG: efflux RND transporter periplasmic adaptor subunit [Thiobacillaceae bacterium]|nr:efflux RND transporter periplasmic adaptor subunit [Thiobacillaceae bacterium]MDW8322634.1 efflux RND transporter periplasmic adaptor subunit [Burkholderiales bacterium]